MGIGPDSYGPPAVDSFGMLSKIGDDASNTIQTVRRRRAFSDPSNLDANGNLDLGRMAKQALSLGDLESAVALSKVQQAQGDSEFNRLSTVEQLRQGQDRNNISRVTAQAQADRAGLEPGEMWAGPPGSPGAAIKPIPGSGKDPTVMAQRKVATDTSDPNAMSPAQIKHLEDTTHRVEFLKDSLDQLTQAKELNDGGQIYQGVASSIVPPVNRLTMGFVGDKDAVAKTTQYNNLVRTAQLSSAKEYFPGRVTNYDEQLLQSITADATKTAAERKAILDTAIRQRKIMLERESKILGSMQSGERFRTTDTPPSPARDLAKTAPSAAVVLPAPPNAKEGDTVRQKSTGKTFTVSGGKLIPVAAAPADEE